MTTFIAQKHRMRVLLDGGGERIVKGIKKKFPARWADFIRTGKVELTDKKYIEILKNAPGYGTDFVVVPEAPKGGPPKEAPKEVKPVLLGKVEEEGRKLSAQELEEIAG